MQLKTLLIISAVFTPLIFAVVIFQGAPLHMESVTPRAIIDMELAKTTTRATEIYNAWSPSRLTIALKNIWIDFLFIIFYGCFFYSAASLLTRWHSKRWQRAGRWISRGIIIAAGFDVIENVLMVKTLGGHIQREVVASTFMFASAKFFLIAIGILFILGTLAARVFLVKRTPASE